MDIHKNARLTPHSRAELVRRVLEGGQTPKAVYKWVNLVGKCSSGRGFRARKYRQIPREPMLNKTGTLASLVAS